MLSTAVLFQMLTWPRKVVSSHYYIHDREKDMTWVTESDRFQVMQKVLVRKQGTWPESWERRWSSLAAISSARADWQFDQFDSMLRRNSFPVNTVCTVLDFAENFNCTFQDEVQATHWCYEQCTIHPIVCYYKGPHCPETVTESLVFISEDRTHDYNAVHAFVSRAVEHVRCVRHIPLDHIIQWADGCAPQYKSKGPFADVSCAAQDYNCTLDRNFFGSRHGKGPLTVRVPWWKVEQLGQLIACNWLLRKKRKVLPCGTVNAASAKPTRHAHLHI